jgi:hypothetical protein
LERLWAGFRLRGFGTREASDDGIQGGCIDGRLQELMADDPVHVGRNIVHGGEDRFHVRQVRVDRFVQGEPIGGLQENLCHQDIATCVGIDPLHGIVRVCRRTDLCPAESR